MDIRTSPVRRRWLLSALGATLAASCAPAQSTSKNVLLLGDSLAEFNSVPETIASTIGFSALPCCIGGTSLSKQARPNYDALGGLKLARAFRHNDWEGPKRAVSELASVGDDNSQMLNSMIVASELEIDAIVLWYGTNDFMQEVPLPQFMNDYAETISLLTERFSPRAIAAVTPVFRWRQIQGDGRDSDHYPNQSGIFLREYIGAMTKAATTSGASVVNLYETAINRTENEMTVSDGVHLDVGDQIMAGHVIGEELSRLLGQ